MTPSPMMAQYLALKAEAPDCLLFFRMGDFYELFFDDAAAAAATLDIALTRRGQHEGQDIPMCGVPVHAAESYLARLVRAGHRVAIAEQTENPADARKRGSKAVVARAIIRIVTPGTLTEEALLEARTANHIAAAVELGDAVALAWADVSTGRFRVQQLELAALPDALARLSPSELIAPEGTALIQGAVEQPRRLFDPAAADAVLRARFEVASLEAFGAFTSAEVAAAGALLAYLDRVGRGAVPHLQPPDRIVADGFMAVDAATRASLELTQATGGGRTGSLLAHIDRTVTGAGARLLADDLAGPLTDPAAIGARLDAVAWFEARPTDRGALRDRLRTAPDIERALARLSAGRGTPRDLGAVRAGLAAALDAKQALLAAATVELPPLLTATLDRIGDHAALVEHLAAALIDEPPINMGDGGFIRAGFDFVLDRHRADAADSRRLIAEQEAALRAATGLPTLKVRFNNVIGYHVEASGRAAEQLAAAGSGFQHRQTMAGAMRFDTDDLRALGLRIAEAGARAQAAEIAHFETLRQRVLADVAATCATAAALARLDVASALAELAATEGWTRPHVVDGLAFAVEGGRHPVVEAACRRGGQAFVPNDCDLSAARRLWLVTGPNMGGKSTFLRQNALIAVLAQAGSFVPARRATIGVVDRLFSRVGASDNLAQGRSTFMVEMVETAAILRQATPRSVVILDEVGRGTSTYDGLAIAWAVLESIHDGLGCRCLFATHYHELTRLERRLPALSLHAMRVREWKGDLVFLHEVGEGAADRSYGLAVARLAGLPPPVVARAKEVLARLEAGRARTGGIAAGLDDLPLFAVVTAAPTPPADPLRERLAAIRPDELSPREALDLLYELKRLGDDG